MAWPPADHADAEAAIEELRSGAQRSPLPTVTFPGVFAETIPRSNPVQGGQGFATTGLTRLQGIRLREGETVSAITYFTGNVMTGATHQWAALCDLAGTVLAISPDGTNAAWTGSTGKTFTMGTPYEVTADSAFYLALCLAATGLPNPMGYSLGGQLWQYTQPYSAATAGTFTGAPPAVGGSIGTITPSSMLYWAGVS
jgi:hypothetical protein